MKLITFRGVRTTPDLKEALDVLETRLSALGDVRLRVTQSSATPLGVLGRELCLSLEGDYSKEDLNCLLWGNAIPCGFTPMDRFPNLNTDTANVFQFYGHWQMLLDNHYKEGQGEFAFSSLVCACQCELGVWEGDRVVERSIQSHLHRLGYSVGAVTGVITTHSLTALRSLGLSNLPLDKTLDRLLVIEKPQKREEDSQTGYLLLPNMEHKVYAYGEVITHKTNNGVSITKKGNGRIVVDLF